MPRSHQLKRRGTIVAESRRASAQVLSVYDHPQFFDLTFEDETDLEADFIEAACKKYGRWPAKRMLEPGCGGGRLIVELAKRGYQMAGFDSSEPALEYLGRQLAERRLKADLFTADLTRFEVKRPVDVAFCTFNTFRHILTEQAAVRHLQCVAESLLPGGIYVLGLHLLPLDVEETCIERWTAQRGATRVTVTLRVTSADRKRRLEQVRLIMLVRDGGREQRFVSEFPLRMYTARQFRSLLAKVPELEVCDVFDFWYEIDQPRKLDDEITDTVVVLRRQ